MDQDELLQTIEWVFETKTTKLDLSAKELAMLPSEIGQLTNLTTLWLYNNYLTGIPYEIGNLTNLKWLLLYNNYLTNIPDELEKLTNLTELLLYNNQLTSIPAKLGNLTNLTELQLHDNQLTSIPAELGNLTNLKVLSLSGNQLSSIPAELGKLINLTTLDLSYNQLTSIPAELGQLTNLTTLYLSENQLKSIPAELSQLTNLTELRLDNNQLTSVPVEIGKLTNLNFLDLSRNRLTSIPSELGKLTNLKDLYLSYNQLTSIPAELGNLTCLRIFWLLHNQLTNIPPEMGKLKNLISLHLSNNQLRSIPKELGELINLRELGLHVNQLKNIPAELSKLKHLEQLDLYGNQLISIPIELGNLTKIEALTLVGNEVLRSPPPEILKQGTKAILAYLRGQLKEGKRQWVSKLLVVGEGGVGKTSLLRALRDEKFVEGLETTHGIGVEKLELKHPSQTDITMELNTWDFGGQQIYHATHQFFLTNRSLFVLVWDTRHGWEAGKLYNWLDRIHAKAPESPVMIVAAHIDEREADLPFEDMQRRYPQIEGHYKISNKTGEGIKDFKGSLANLASNLPLMGERWPASWINAANEIRSIEDSYISPKRLDKLMAKHKMEEDSVSVLAQWLHELGDILYFKDDDELNDLVILNSQWVNEAISDVLESDEVIKKDGILTREHRDKLWGNVDENIREHFLRLMERFDLSYRTLENREISLVVERLPLDPPDYHKKWKAIQNTEGCKEISMKFSLNSMPAGIPTWFIARSHRFTTHTHWRMGALFTDNNQQSHLALIEAYPYERYLQLTVRGPAPHNFFALLRDGLELTLARFPGLKIKRTVPCPGHDGGQCAHEFDFAKLQKAIERDKPVMEVQCQEAFENVSVTGLLFGLHWSTESKVISRIDELQEKIIDGQQEILTELRELRELAQREFLRLFNSQQQFSESHCPNVFAILPKIEKSWSKKFFRQKMVLQLFCQEPGHWHPAMEGTKGGRYKIMRPSGFLETMGPYIVKLAKVIKYAAPVAGAAVGAYVGPIGAVMGAEYAKKLATQIKLMEELAKKLTERDYALAHIEAIFEERGEPERIEGMELRALRTLLDKEDPQQEWGGLKKVLTPEGHYLWLCEQHAAEYKK
jgi:internalin A